MEGQNENIVSREFNKGMSYDNSNRNLPRVQNPRKHTKELNNKTPQKHKESRKDNWNKGYYSDR